MEEWGLAKMKGVLLTEESLHRSIDDKIDNIDATLFEDEEEIEKYRTSLHEQIEWLYVEALCEHITPIGVEVNFKLDGLIPECIAFIGTIDRIVGDLSKKDVDLEDYKSGKTYTKKELSNNMQATIYSLAFYKMFGFLPNRFVFYFSKTKKKKIIYITPEFIKLGTERILSSWFKMRNGEFEPNNKNKFFCKNFCSANKSGLCSKQSKKFKNNWDEVI